MREITPESNAPNCGNEDGHEVENSDANADGEQYNDKSIENIFDCPEDGCIAKFRTSGRLENHIIRSKHQFQPERITLKDHALGLYSAAIENIQMDRLIKPLQDVIHELEADETTGYEKVPLAKGWALPPKKQETCSPITSNHI